ncbi:hypothetical protein GEU84_000070 [Fertoebacter nigrum]|uniref:General secretion pathway protein N n=1 Tax=Fertoeibacter niger TaxID=2656921 RepID=A0A8X8H4I1_9RHOB|nr:hypothetical protein [Fertoeibacter niger]NUB42766.1 hypothetical protein [Fertoeibacter niger]
MPLRFAAQQVGLPVAADRLSGTLWHGALRLEGGHSLRWDTDALASLTGLALVAGWQAEGPGTALAGQAALRPGGLVLDRVAGTAGWALAEAAMPGLPITCTATAQVAGLRLALARGAYTGEGRISAAPGTCARVDGAVPPVPTPALLAELTTTADGVQAVLTGETPGLPLLTALLTQDDRLRLTIHAAGAALVPGMPASADSEIELPLAALLP